MVTEPQKLAESVIEALARGRDARDIGERVLAALDAGREKGIRQRQAQAAVLRDAVAKLAEDDAALRTQIS